MADLEERVANLESELKEAKEKIQQLFTLVQSGGSGSASAKPKAPARKPSSASTTASARPPSSAKSTNGAAKKPAAKPTLSSASKVPDEKIAVDPAYLVTYNIGKRKQHVVIPGDVDPAQAKLAAEAKTGLTLSRVYGFNGKAARHNLFHSREQAGSIIYSVAATGVVMDTKTGQQNFFTGHNEDILCVAYHPSRPVVATGQLDPKGKGTPFTCVWTYTENGTQELCRIVFHDRGVCAVQFSADGKYLLTIGNDDSHTLAIFDWENTKHKGQKAVPVLETMTSKDEVFGMEVNRHSTEQKGIDIEFVTFGSKTLKHWAVSNITHDDVKQRTAKSRIISVSNKTNIVQKSYGCVEFLPSGEYLVGCASGHIYRMKQDSLVTFFAAHSKAVGAIRAIENGFVSAGADGKFVMWDNSNNQTASIDLQDGGAGRSISISGNTAVVGTASNSIIEVDLGSHNQRVLMVGHSNEVWGLAVANNLLVTGGFDKKVIAWDFQSGEFIPVHSLATGSKVKSVAFNPDGTRLALGMDNGHVQVVSVADWSTEWDKDFAKETIDGLAWSPDGSSIAAGSWDQNLYLIDASNGAKKATCSGHTSSVLMVNWSQDGNYLQSNSRDYEILYWTSAGKRLKDRLEIKDIKWSAWNCFLGWCVAGIWGGTGDGTDINAVDRSHNESVLAAGDDFGMVRLYNYPAVNANSPPKEYPGHSSHVTNVRFSPDDSVLFSTGGGDCGVFMWKHE